MNTMEDTIAALKRLPPEERDRWLDQFWARLHEAEYMKRQTEYERQEEQRRILDRKAANEADDYGMPEYTP